MARVTAPLTSRARRPPTFVVNATSASVCGLRKDDTPTWRRAETNTERPQSRRRRSFAFPFVCPWYPEADRLARELAHATGESITTAVAIALSERLERLRGLPRGRDLAGELNAIALRCAALPVLDDRPEEEILGYDQDGLAG